MSEFLIRYKNAGYSFFNTKSADKKIFTQWKVFTTRKPTDYEIKTWLRLPTQNWAIVTGKISNLIVIDVDTKNGGDPAPFQNRGFYEIKTPSGGYHFYFKYDPILADTKHNQTTGILKGVDIQSDMALAFCPPSFFEGKGGYTLIKDAPIVPIPDDLLTKILEALEPEKKAKEYTPYTPTKDAEMGRPGDVFNALATWDDVLIPFGWTRVGNSRHTQYWRRPGKTDGISASTNWNDYDLLFSFSTSVDELIPKKGYTKFNAYATLKFNGDYREAAKSLVMENYKIANKLI